MNMIPLSALAAILIVTGFKLTHPKLFKQLYQKVGDSFTIHYYLGCNLVDRFINRNLGGAIYQ